MSAAVVHCQAVVWTSASRLDRTSLAGVVARFLTWWLTTWASAMTQTAVTVM